MENLVKIWYVSSQRLCNFRCTYCVSIGDYAKSNTYDWKHGGDFEDAQKIVRWIAGRPFPVGVRLATLGEPFASREFLGEASWLTRQPQVRFVELLTNGSLLKRRLPQLAQTADLSKLSLWITHHDSEISAQRLIENAAFAQEAGCFVVVNALLFPHNADRVAELRTAAEQAGLRFHLDLGYDPGAPSGAEGDTVQLAPALERKGGLQEAIRLGADPEMLQVNLLALGDVRGRPCQAGHNYLYIGIDGDVYPCSRYYVLKQDRLGNALDPEFDLTLRDLRWDACKAKSGCCNKEDFLNLRVWAEKERPFVPSFGWKGA
ncbi:radical SAM protein [Streptomyces chartreusis]|uniref:radical SAM protein n=1 Tax=Streptomyces chartreusis TaxID=1969 RepID=UPI0038114FB1